MKLMVDNNLSPLLGRGLGELFKGTHQVVHIKDKFGTGALKDEDWIERLGKEGGWCVLSGDRQIAKRRPSRELFLRAGLVGFFPLPAVLDMTRLLCARGIRRENATNLVPTTEARSIVDARKGLGAALYLMAI